MKQNPLAAAHGTDALTFDDALFAGGFVMIPSALMRSSDFSGNAKTLYGILLTYAIDKDVVWPGHDTLCAQLGVSEPTLRKVLGELEAAHLLTIERRGRGKTDRYHLRKMACAPVRRSRPARKHRAMQSAKILQSRVKNSFTPYKETELKEGEIEEAAATHAHPRKVQPVAITPPLAAAADIHHEKPDTPPLPSPDVPLVEYSETDLARLRQTNPGELVRRFRSQNPSYTERMNRKAAKAHTSPNILLARCILEDWLPELRTVVAAGAPVSDPYKPKIDRVPDTFLHTMATFTPKSVRRARL